MRPYRGTRQGDHQLLDFLSVTTRPTTFVTIRPTVKMKVFTSITNK